MQKGCFGERFVRLKMNNHVVIWIKSCDADWHHFWMIAGVEEATSHWSGKIQMKDVNVSQNSLGACSASSGIFTFLHAQPL